MKFFKIKADVYTVNSLSSPPWGLLMSSTLEGGLLERGVNDFLKICNSQGNTCCLKIDKSVYTV